MPPNSTSTARQGSGNFTSLLKKGNKDEQVSLAQMLGIGREHGDHEDSTCLASAMERLQWLKDLYTHPVGLQTADVKNAIGTSLQDSQKTVKTLYDILSKTCDSEWHSKCRSDDPIEQHRAGIKLKDTVGSLEAKYYVVMAEDVRDVAKMASWNLASLKTQAELFEGSLVELIKKKCEVDDTVATRWAESIATLKDFEVIMPIRGDV